MAIYIYIGVHIIFSGQDRSSELSQGASGKIVSKEVSNEDRCIKSEFSNGHKIEIFTTCAEIYVNV